MSYSFSFTQFPTKEFNELWDDFVRGKMSEKIGEKILELQNKQEELLKLPRFSQKTFYEDREEWVRCQKNFEAAKLNEEQVGSWQSLKITIAEQESYLQQATSEKEIRKIVRDALEIFMGLFGKDNAYAPRILFVADCDTYSDSAKGNGYAFLQQLYRRVHGVNLEDIKEMPTNEQWYTLFQALKPEFVEAELSTLFAEIHVSKAEYEDTRTECLQFLHILKGLLKGCLDRKWDLWFSSEFQAIDLEEKQKKILENSCTKATLASKRLSK